MTQVEENNNRILKIREDLKDPTNGPLDAQDLEDAEDLIAELEEQNSLVADMAEQFALPIATIDGWLRKIKEDHYQMVHDDGPAVDHDQEPDVLQVSETMSLWAN